MIIDKSQLKILPLEQNSQVDSFKCVNEDLNEFLRDEAKAYQAEMLSMTYLVYYEQELVAYFSMLYDAVNLREFDKRTRNRINRRIPFVKQRAHYPAVKLGRLAVDYRYAHQGIGELILRLILSMFATNNKAACRFITVDAIANATGFYQEKGGFHFFTDEDKDSDTRLMYFDLLEY